VTADENDAPLRHAALAALGEIAAEVAHELRNLLQVVSSSAFVARLEVDRGDTVTARAHIGKVERSARLAHALVDDLLSLARGESLHKEGVSVAGVVSAARADFAEGAARWEDTLMPADLELRAHPRLLERLLHALYENAVLAAAPRAPTVSTRAVAEGERVVFVVSDDGPGVPPAIAARLFEPLVTGRSGGTGLGLALARRIVSAHGGTLALDAPVPGQGASFRFELPR
jgi:signal transduction histidine kinase